MKRACFLLRKLAEVEDWPHNVDVVRSLLLDILQANPTINCDRDKIAPKCSVRESLHFEHTVNTFCSVVPRGFFLQICSVDPRGD